MKNIADECFNDAITDKCLDNAIRELIEHCDKQRLNSALFEECASLYEKLLQTGNAERFHASCTTIAIKIADNPLVFSQKDCTQSHKHKEEELSSRGGGGGGGCSTVFGWLHH